MAKYLINWKVNPQMLPARPKERMKLLQSMNEMIKEALTSGEIKDWGEYCDGSGGYAIGEGSEADLFASLTKWRPYCDFDAKPVLAIDQVIDLFESATKQAFDINNGTPESNPLDNLISDIQDL
jgi:hypothetical protein